MRRQRLTTELLDGPLQFARLFALGSGRVLEKHVGYDERAGNRVLLRLDERQPHPRMAVEHGFDFLRMYFEPANVNHAVAPAPEVIAAVAQLEYVAGVDKTSRVFQCGRIRAEV